ncbi:hypothetical protein DAEQUDRAFT_490057 [Daedalea quercina L-15889]|uniref:Fungal-type protein kinase domain-containing protein n=1 Tax=Daedalea quercina L-15889 TaxID=1314783 RepID=A0A165MNW3_9APHY|nr:hypothetical protein DAEQUDRAFT_490057 [Daedalea quercina L-15889]
MSTDLSSVALEKNQIRSDKRNSLQSNSKLVVERGLPVIDFVRAVWGYTPDMIPYRDYKQPYRLSRELVNAYLSVGERTSYSIFAFIVMSLLGQLYPGTPASVASGSSQSRKIKAMVINTRATSDEKTIEQGGTKPDLTWTTEPKDPKLWRLIWESCLAFVEIKRPPAMPLFLAQDLCIDLSALEQPYESNNALISDEDTDTDDDSFEEDIKDNRSLSASPGPDEPAAKRACRRDSLASSTLVDTAEYVNGPLSDDELHVALYIMEMMERNIRSFASGFSVKGTTVTLWYGDRMGLVASTEFNFLEEPHLLLLAVAALGAADADRFGVCPYLTRPSYGDLLRPELFFPPMKACDAYGVPMDKQGVFKVYHPGPDRLTFGRRQKLVGTGTIVFPLKAIMSQSILDGDNEQLIAKVSWPYERSSAETTTLKLVYAALVKKAPRYLKHVTELKCYVEESFAEHGLPRAAMLGLETEKPRRFVLMVMMRYEPLYLIPGVADFQKVYIEVVRAHWWVAETSNILHGDISLNNIMFFRRDDEVIGVLMDWDHAVHRHRSEEARYDLELPSSDDPLLQWVYRYRTAHYWYTAPYVDLGRQTAARREMPPHRYAHDLEAFFWMLLHFLQQFEPENRSLLPTRYFDIHDDAGIARWKRAFLETQDAFEDAEVRVHDDYLPVWDAWVPGLREIFRTAYSFGTPCPMSERFIRDCLKEFAEEGNEEEVERIVPQLREKIRVRKEAVTYEAFMAVLDAPLDFVE